jgi:hypothetical protein
LDKPPTLKPYNGFLVSPLYALSGSEDDLKENDEKSIKRSNINTIIDARSNRKTKENTQVRQMIMHLENISEPQTCDTIKKIQKSSKKAQHYSKKNDTSVEPINHIISPRVVERISKKNNAANSEVIVVVEKKSNNAVALSTKHTEACGPKRVSSKRKKKSEKIKKSQSNRDRLRSRITDEDIVFGDAADEALNKLKSVSEPPTPRICFHLVEPQEMPRDVVQPNHVRHHYRNDSVIFYDDGHKNNKKTSSSSSSSSPPALIDTAKKTRGRMFDVKLFFHFFETHLKKEYNLDDQINKKSKKVSPSGSSSSLSPIKKKSPILKSNSARDRLVTTTTTTTPPTTTTKSDDSVQTSKSTPTFGTHVREYSKTYNSLAESIKNDKVNQSSIDYYRFLKDNKPLINNNLTISIGFKENILKQIFEKYSKKDADRLANMMVSLYGHLELHIVSDKTKKKSVRFILIYHKDFLMVFLGKRIQKIQNRIDSLL